MGRSNFSFDFILRVDSSLPGGAAGVWQKLGVRLNDGVWIKHDLVRLRLAVITLFGTGEKAVVPGLVRSVDGKIALLNYLLWADNSSSREIFNFFVHSMKYPANQDLAEQLHAVQSELYGSVAYRDVTDCTLEPSKRKAFLSHMKRLLDLGLNGQLPARQVYRVARRLIKRLGLTKPILSA